MKLRLLMVYVGMILGLLFSGQSYASAVVKPFSKIGPIHRGFTKEENTFRFDLMGQGKIHKKARLSCLATEDPGCYGIAKINNQIQLFAMPKEDLRVGRTFFEWLDPEKEYDVQVGYLEGELAQHSDNVVLDWSEADNFKITTPSLEPKNITSILYGSCARIGKVGPLVLWQKKVRKILGAMVTNIAEAKAKDLPTDMVVTLGDFPYMDATGELTAAKNFEEMYDRVELLYGLDTARLLMKKAPFRQMRDDHEWWNNSTAEIPAGYEERAAAARRIYDLFQRPQGAETKTNYQIPDDGVDTFICDTRSERFPSGDQPQFMSAEQTDALQAWLSDPIRKDRIKRVLFSGPVFMLQTDDNFWKYKEEFAVFMNWIKVNDIKDVVFGTGDIHVGKTGLWKLAGEDDNPGNFILEDASSAFHKINHNKDGLLKDECDLSNAGGPKLTAKGGLSPTVTEDHFTRMTSNHAEHTVQVSKYDSKNRLLMDVIYNLKDGTYDNVPHDPPVKYQVKPKKDDEEEEL